MNHKGFSVIEILQHCPTYSKATPAARYEQKVYDVKEDASYDSSNKWEAMARSENYDHIATGVLYHDKTAKDFMSLQPQRTKTKTTAVDEVATTDITALLANFAIDA